MRSYLNLLEDILENGESHNDRTGVGTVSVFGRQWRHDMRTGFPLLTTKKLPLRWIAEELFWFLSGSTDEADLRATGVDIWKEWADADTCSKFGREPGKMGPVYGGLWRKYPIGISPDDQDANPSGVHTIDQLWQLLSDIEKSPASRRLIVTGWHPFYQKRVSLPPCHTLWQCKVHEESKEISLHLYARSIDSFLGLPFNIASYGLLLTLLGAVTGLSPRDLIISFGDVHIYKNHLDQVREQISREPRELPRLAVSEAIGFGVEGLLSCRWDHLSLQGYLPHPKLTAAVAV